jgi:NADPH-dependent curcumin reductase CurA
LKEGDLVVGEVGWREEAVMPGDALTKVDGKLGGLDAHLGVLGASGLTAFFLVEKARITPGETVLVAPAAGSVGMIAVQLLAQRGAKVAALIGGSMQAEFVTALGASSAIDHHRDDLAAAMKAAMPGGWDAFLDGVGGASHDAALATMKVKARLVLFGFVSGYGRGGPPAYGSAGSILMKRATAEGFLLADHAARSQEARAALARMLEDCTLEARNAVTDGLENAPAAFAALFGEARPGKQLVRL